jgi:hypothetical protein
VRVLVIPEDQTLDQYIAKPVVEALVKDVGFKAKVDVLPEPRLHGTGEALDQEIVAEIVADNPMIDLFLLVVDRDCDRQENVAKAAAREEEHEGKLLHCLAVEEIEVWMLALYKNVLSASFSDIRKDCDPKERYAEPFLKQQGRTGPGGGRKHAMKAIAGKWQSLKGTCPELEALQDQVRAWWEAQRP